MTWGHQEAPGYRQTWGQCEAPATSMTWEQSSGSPPYMPHRPSPPQHQVRGGGGGRSPFSGGRQPSSRGSPPWAPLYSAWGYPVMSPLQVSPGHPSGGVVAIPSAGQFGGRPSPRSSPPLAPPRLEGGRRAAPTARTSPKSQAGPSVVWCGPAQPIARGVPAASPSSGGRRPGPSASPYVPGGMSQGAPQYSPTPLRQRERDQARKRRQELAAPSDVVTAPRFRVVTTPAEAARPSGPAAKRGKSGEKGRRRPRK